MERMWRVHTMLCVAGMAIAVVLGMVWGAAAAPPKGDGPEAMGLTVFTAQDEVDLGYGDAEVTMTMTLVNAAGEESRREMGYASFEMADDGDKTLITFEHPPDVKGTALLSFEHVASEDDQWLYLPALKRVKRIASKNKSGSFVGSEFSYEDISSNEPEKYSYRYLREDAYGGAPVWVVERYPKDPNSGYTKIVTWVNQTNSQNVKHEFFDRKGDPLKVQVNSGHTRYLDKFWRPKVMAMENLQSKKKTVLEFRDWQFQQGFSESRFSTRALERQR